MRLYNERARWLVFHHLHLRLLIENFLRLPTKKKLLTFDWGRGFSLDGKEKKNNFFTNDETGTKATRIVASFYPRFLFCGLTEVIGDVLLARRLTRRLEWTKWWILSPVHWSESSEAFFNDKIAPRVIHWETGTASSSFIKHNSGFSLLLHPPLPHVLITVRLPPTSTTVFPRRSIFVGRVI